MNNLNAIAIFTFLLIFNNAFSQNQKLGTKDLNTLKKSMAGEFSSEEQSKNDTDFYHIVLRMKPIWKKDKDGFWLYVEQAMNTSQDKPYRQRVYHVFLRDDSTIISKVFEIQNPGKYTGGWDDESKLKGLSKDSLIDRQGCEISLHKKSDGTFSGSTPGKECLSSLRGATYATSEVIINSNKIISWDRGWDSTDKQVWGAVKSGYVFNKLKDW